MAGLSEKYCPIVKSIQVLGDDWTLLIVKELLTGPKRFNYLREEILGITSRTLTNRLKKMVDIGLINRKQYAETPPRVEYSLTDMGEELRSLIDLIESFGNKWFCKS